MLFVTICYYPYFDVNSLSDKVIDDINEIITNTNAWKTSSPEFRKEFEKMLNKY